ncbi:MAG: IS6 family transposase [Thermoplasmata archaeon]|nr:IS6 family transposase [Thermoplasmata archaeon]
MDETKVKIENNQIYIWNAIDVDDISILAVHVSSSRTSFDAIYFLRKMLEKSENKPLVLVDRGPWYRFALERPGLEYGYQKFGKRNAIEQWYGLLKARLKSFWKRFPYHSFLQPVKNWIVAWCAIYNLVEV